MILAAIIAIIALIVFVFVALCEYKSTADVIVMIVSGLIFQAASLYSVTAFTFGVIQ